MLPFNRTSLGLKLKPRWSRGGYWGAFNRTSLGLKQPQPEPSPESQLIAFNRTSLGLKQMEPMDDLWKTAPFNRTSLGLKQRRPRAAGGAF